MDELTFIVMKGKVWAVFCQSETEPFRTFILVVGSHSPNDLQEGNKGNIMEIYSQKENRYKFVNVKCIQVTPYCSCCIILTNMQVPIN